MVTSTKDVQTQEIAKQYFQQQRYVQSLRDLRVSLFHEAQLLLESTDKIAKQRFSRKCFLFEKLMKQANKELDQLGKALIKLTGLKVVQKPLPSVKASSKKLIHLTSKHTRQPRKVAHG